MKIFTQTTEDIKQTIAVWEPKLLALTDDLITSKSQNGGWCVKEILGHLIDSATNNLHRIINLQFRHSPLVFPDYGNLGNNSNWIKIQNYMTEDWTSMVELWKYTNLHLAHVIENVDEEKLNNIWITALGKEVSLKDMINDYPRHLKHHLSRIEEMVKE